MSRVRITISIVALLSPSLALAGPKIDWTIVVPPAHVLEGVHSVAMGQFTGPQADKLRDYMQAEIAGRNGAATAGLTMNVFKVTTGDADAKIGATVSVPDPVITDYTDEVTKYKDNTSYKVTEYCRKREITVNVRMSVYGKDGTLLTQEEVGGTARSNLCKDTLDQLKHAIDTGEFPTQNNAVEEVLRSDAPGLVNSIMPYRRGTAGELLVEKAVKGGNKMARDGQLQQAVTFWLGVINVDPYNASAAYNIGLMFEAVDDLDNAKIWYTKAGALQAKDEITQSLTRVSGRSDQVAVLTQHYGMTHTPGVLSAVVPDAAAAAVQTVTVSGGKNLRIPLRDAGSDSAGVVVQLPGGMMLTVVEVQGAWVKVRTADGKEGFLMGKEVDGLKK